MIVTRLTHRFVLAVACCLVIIFLPMSGGAQGILKKGAQGIQKGVETGAEKTKEGAEAVGHGVKNTVTGDDTSRMKSSETNRSTEPSQATAPSQPSTRSQATTPSQPAAGETGNRPAGNDEARAGGKLLPATAGELPLLAFIGVLALAASGTSKLFRRVRTTR